jgi:hypothetical protein
MQPTSGGRTVGVPFRGTVRHPSDTIPVQRFGPNSDPAQIKAAVDAARARPFRFNPSNPDARLAFTTPLTEHIDGDLVDTPSEVGVPPAGHVNGRRAALANIIQIAKRNKARADAFHGDEPPRQQDEPRASVRFSSALDPTARTTACFDDDDDDVTSNFVGPTTGRRTDATTGRGTRTSYALLAGPDPFGPPAAAAAAGALPRAIRTRKEAPRSDDDDDDEDAIEHPRDAGFRSPVFGRAADPLLEVSDLTPVPHDGPGRSAEIPGDASDGQRRQSFQRFLFSTVLDITPGGATVSSNGRKSVDASVSSSTTSSPGDQAPLLATDAAPAPAVVVQPQTAAGFLALARAQAAREYQQRVSVQIAAAAAAASAAKRKPDTSAPAPLADASNKSASPEGCDSHRVVSADRDCVTVPSGHALPLTGARATAAGQKSERREDADGFALPPQRVPQQPLAAPLPRDSQLQQQPRFTAARLSTLDGAGCDAAVPRDTTTARVTRELRFTAFSADPAGLNAGRATTSHQRPSIAPRLTSVANTNALPRAPQMNSTNKIDTSAGCSDFDLSENKQAALAIDVLHKTWYDADRANPEHASGFARAMAIATSTPGPLSPGETVLTLAAVQESAGTGGSSLGGVGAPLRLSIETYVEESEGVFTAALSVPPASSEGAGNALGLKIEAGATCGCLLLTGKRGNDERLVTRAAALVRGAAFLGRTVAVVRIEPCAAGALGRCVLIVTSAGRLRTLPAVAAVARKIQPPEATEIRVEVATLLLRLANQIASSNVALGGFDPSVVFVGFERTDGAPFAMAIPPLEFAVSTACFTSSRGLVLRWPALAAAPPTASWATPAVVERLAHSGVTPCSVIRDALALIFVTPDESPSDLDESCRGTPAVPSMVAPFPVNHKAAAGLKALQDVPESMLGFGLAEALMKLPSALPLLTVVAEHDD